MVVEEVPTAALQVRIQGIPVYQQRKNLAGRQASACAACRRAHSLPTPPRTASPGHAGLAAACCKGSAHRVSPGRLDPGVRGACAVVVGRVQAVWPAAPVRLRLLLLHPPTLLPCAVFSLSGCRSSICLAPMCGAAEEGQSHACRAVQACKWQVSAQLSGRA